MTESTINADNNQNQNDATNNLNSDEKKRLQSAEASIRNGLKSFYNVGRALSDISQFRLYRETHSTFAKYAKEKWDMTTARVSQLQHAYRVHALLSSLDIKPLPATESQCRPLVRIPADADMDARIVKVWSDVITTAGAAKITAKMVNDAVDAELGIDKQHAGEEKQDAKSSAGAGPAAGAEGNEESASAEMRAMVRELKRKVAYLESALEAEKQAHKRTEAKKGIPTSATAKQLFKAGYRAMAKSAHPDHGGDEKTMQELNELKDILGI